MAKNKLKPPIRQFQLGDRVSYQDYSAKVLAHSRENESMVIIEYDKTFKVVQVNSSELKQLPKEVDVDSLTDFDNTLKIMKDTISFLIEKYGPESELYTDAGYNNVRFKLRLK